jgi:predicted Rossmann-fold nucleotide-binding protein
MRVIVCGGRNYADVETLGRRLGAFHARHGIAAILHGDARGADRLAARWGAEHGISTLAFPADWSRGLSAGPLRNAAMLMQRPDAVIAFPGGVGTADMIRKARVAGVPVWIVGQVPSENAA